MCWVLLSYPTLSQASREAPRWKRLGHGGRTKRVSGESSRCTVSFWPSAWGSFDQLIINIIIVQSRPLWSALDPTESCSPVRLLHRPRTTPWWTKSSFSRPQPHGSLKLDNGSPSSSLQKVTPRPNKQWMMYSQRTVLEFLVKTLYSAYTVDIQTPMKMQDLIPAYEYMNHLGDHSDK